MTRRRRCVHWRNRTEQTDGWCIVAGRVDKTATAQATLCGYVIMLPGDYETREPTCRECIARSVEHNPAQTAEGA